MAIHVILLIIAFICFILATIPVPVPRVNLTAMGLAFWVLAVLLGSGGVVVR